MAGEGGTRRTAIRDNDPVHDVETFGLIVAVTAVAVGIAVLGNRLSERIRIPAPVLFLVVAAVASDVWHPLYALSPIHTERIVTVALVMILFDGGMHLGWRRVSSAIGVISVVGIAGTVLTGAGLAVCAHVIFGVGWTPALLLGTALAPTDPAVVFSVLGRREIVGRAGTILEGESGANDPVGIALLLALATMSGSGGSVALAVVGNFVLQMAVGLAVGLAGGWVLLQFIRRVPLPAAGLYPLRVLAGAFALYGIASVAHGSGFLAAFVAGVLLGDQRAPYKTEIERFSSALASLGEIVAFAVLGFSVHLADLSHHRTWLIGIVLAALLAFVIRPLLVGPLLLTVDLRRGEKAFVLWSGLKGAVPILLGTFLLSGHVADAHRLYAVIIIVVVFSVVVQGGLVPDAARLFGVRMQIVEPEPWAVGLRLRQEPEGLRRYVVRRGSAADGTTIADLPASDGIWISIVTRDGQLVPSTGDLVLRTGDEVLAIVDESDETSIGTIFTDAVG